MNTNAEAGTSKRERAIAVDPGTPTREQPIGVFDSGVGGLSVLREIRRELPDEHLLYAADSGYAPYGEKPAAFIEARTLRLVEFLVAQGAKAIVLACNTATGLAIEAVRAAWAIPVVGIEPAIKPAAAATRSGVVGVLATSQTIASARFARLLETFGQGVTIAAQACPGLVEQVERGDLAGEETLALVTRYVRPLVDRHADILVLGCTHYPFLTPAIQAVAGGGVTILDPSAAVARELRRRLEERDLLAPAGRPVTTRFWTSAPPERLAQVLDRLGIAASDVQRLPV